MASCAHPCGWCERGAWRALRYGHVLQLANLAFGQVSPLPDLHWFNFEFPDRGANKLDDGMPNLIKHAPDLLVAPFVESNFEPGVRLTFAQLAHLGRGGPLTFVNYDAASQSFDGFLSRHAFHFGRVNFWNLIFGRRNDIREFAVGGQQQQAFCVEVQPADSMQS